jgi:tetratricopeptide (TPR) repeat protein
MRLNLLIALSTVVATSLPAHAAVTVLGNGLAAACFQAAEFGADPKAAVPTCSDALQDEPLTVSDRAATYINRGILRARAGDSFGALADCNQGLTLNASMGDGYVDRGTVYIVLQKYDDALADIDRGIAMGAHKPQIAYYDRAIVNEALGNVRAAYLDYKKAVELEPKFTLATEQLARFKVVRKDNASN